MYLHCATGHRTVTVKVLKPLRVYHGCEREAYLLHAVNITSSQQDNFSKNRTGKFIV